MLATHLLGGLSPQEVDLVVAAELVALDDLPDERAGHRPTDLR
ncbi:hypothetical protein ACQP1G_21405 [Nocardia sp. CA-107356]